MTRKTRFLFRFEKQKPRTRERQAFPWSTRRGGGSHCSLAAPPGSATAISNYVDNFIMLQAPSVRAWPFGFSRIQTVRTRAKRRHERHASITAFTYHVRFAQLSHFPASFLDCDRVCKTEYHKKCTVRIVLFKQSTQMVSKNLEGSEPVK